MTLEEERNIKCKLQSIADDVIARLRGKVIIHRYDAYSTNSIYLKFDYGVANSLRISDHPDKKHLRYRYNILTTQKSKAVKKQKGIDRLYYSADMIEAVCRDILKAKDGKMARYRNYDVTVQEAKERTCHEKGFWQDAKEIM